MAKVMVLASPGAEYCPTEYIGPGQWQFPLWRAARQHERPSSLRHSNTGPLLLQWASCVQLGLRSSLLVVTSGVTTSTASPYSADEQQCQLCTVLQRCRTSVSRLLFSITLRFPSSSSNTQSLQPPPLKNTGSGNRSCSALTSSWSKL
jgi:hypothetical protein